MTHHKFIGSWGTNMVWEGAQTRQYNDQVTESWLIGKKEGAENFAFRYYQISPGGGSSLEQHPYDHGVLVLRGSGEARIDDQIHQIGAGDILYIPPDITHQLMNTGEDPLGFLCVIPARRQKAGRVVWAEEGIDFGA